MIIPVFVKNSAAVTFGVIVLPASQSVQKSHQAKSSQYQRYRYKVRQNVHLRPRNRKAFKDTVIDDVDMASAAISGVAKPATASGTATTL